MNVLIVPRPGSWMFHVRCFDCSSSSVLNVPCTVFRLFLVQCPECSMYGGLIVPRPVPWMFHVRSFDCSSSSVLNVPCTVFRQNLIWGSHSFKGHLVSTYCPLFFVLRVDLTSGFAVFPGVCFKHIFYSQLNE